MLACALSKKYFAWLCNPSAGSLSYNTRVTTSHCACARRSGGSGLRSGSRTVGVEVMQSDSLSETVGLAPPRWAGAMAGAGLDGTQPHAGSGTRARIGKERSGSGPPPISSSRSHRSPRPTTARCPEQIQHINMQDAGRGTRWRGVGSTPNFIFTVTPITSANNGAMPRTDSTHQHAGRGARQMAEPDAPTERGESR